MHGKALRYVCRQFHESHSKLSSDQPGRSALAALQSDENPERGLSGAHRERESRRTALAVAAQECKHVAQAYPRRGILFCAEGMGRMRVGDETLTAPKYGGVLVGPDQLRQVFNDTDAEVLWLIVDAPEELEFLPGAKTKPDMSLIYPVDPKQLPKEVAGVEWPPKC